jgi:hypothetical protein
MLGEYKFWQKKSFEKLFLRSFVDTHPGPNDIKLLMSVIYECS